MTHKGFSSYLASLHYPENRLGRLGEGSRLRILVAVTVSLLVLFFMGPSRAYADDWVTQNIGPAQLAGSSSMDAASGAWTIQGAGTDVGGSADQCEFVYQTLDGNGMIIARVTSLLNTNASAKAGIMIRNTLDAGSANAYLALTAGNGVAYQDRAVSGSTSSVLSSVAGTAAPVWLRLERNGNSFIASISSDGVTWGIMSKTTLSMVNTVYVGLAVTSRTATKLTTASFDNVSLIPGVLTEVSAPSAPTLVGGARSSVSVALSWNGATDDVGINAYSVLRNSVVVATLPGTSSAYTDNGLTSSTSYAYTVTATDASGKVSGASNSVTVTTDVAGSGVLGSSGDIGAVGLTGSTAYASGSSAWTLQGAGADIAGTADAFRFGYQPCNGDTQVVARVSSIQNTNSWSKAGVMIRASLDANAPEASVLMTYSSGVVFQSRKSTGTTTVTSPAYPYASLANRRAPQWVKLVRHGDAFAGYVSVDGVNWEYVGGDTVAMAPAVYAGIGVSSHTTSALCSAVFTNLDISPISDSSAPSVPSGLSVYSLSDVSLSLSWAPANDDAGVSGYNIFEDGTLVAVTPYARFTDTFQDPGAVHSYTVQAIDAVGNLSPASLALSVTLKLASLPPPWVHNDIGAVEWAGTASLNGGVFGISGAGLDIGSTGDSFHYIYQPLNGDQTITARISSIPNPPNTSVKAGVMIRETLDAGARNAMLLVLGGSGSSLQWRAAADGTCVGVTGDASAKPPYWIRLVRGGNRFAGYESTDGATWVLAGTCTVPMASSGYIGLALTSHDPRVLASATFDSVQIATDSDGNGLPDAWELTWFNKIGVDPNALAARNDGLTNLQAFQQGLNPLDYYNGVTPTITIVGGNGQNGAINTLLNLPLTIRLTSSGNPLVNAPVTVTVSSGSGYVTSSPGTVLSTTSVLHSDTNGQVSVYYQDGPTWGVRNIVKMAAGRASVNFSATALAQVGHWSFNSHTGTTTPDSSNTGNGGNLVGCVTWTTGFDGGGAVWLDGTTAYLEAKESPTMALGYGSMSVTAWVCCPKGLQLNDESAIYPLVTLGDRTIDGLSLCLRGGGHGLEARVNTAAGIVQVDGTAAGNTLPDGNWHQVGFTWDGNGGVSIVLDGSIVASAAGIPISPVAAPCLWLGRDSSGRFFGGGIDEVEARRDLLAASDLLARYNVDSNNDGMADWWEWRYFGTLYVIGTADPDGDGLTNIQEAQNGTSPFDYFNGISPILTKISGDNQNGTPGCYLSQGLAVSVSRRDGTLLVNAPVIFTVQSGGGSIASTPAARTKLPTVTVYSGTDGIATAYYQNGSAFGIPSQIRVSSGSNGCMFTANSVPLIAQWKFGDGSGSVAQDSSNTGNNAALNGGVTWSQGYDGQGAVSLDGTSGYLSAGPNPTLAIGGTNALTVAGWFRFSPSLPLSSTNNIYPIVSFGSGMADVLSLAIEGGVGGASVVLVNGTSNAAVGMFDPATLANGDWHHLGFSCDVNGNVLVAFDGAIVASATGVKINTTSSPRVWLGRDGMGHFLSGGLDDFCIRRTASVQSDFQALYNAGIDEGGLPNWWKWKQFATLNVEPNAVSGTDGLTNLQKYQTPPAPVIISENIPGLPDGRGLVGKVLWERWCGPELLNTTIGDIRRFGKYPLHPDESRTLANFAIDSSAGKISSCSRLRAYFIPPVSGAYCFYVTGQEVASLSISLSGKSYDRQLACSGTMVAPDAWSQGSSICYLQAGSRYYFEFNISAEKHPGYGAVGWTTPTDNVPKPIPSQYLISMGAEDDSNDVGMSDDWQTTHFGGLTQWSNQDPDGDGLTNVQEFQRGSDPMKNDTGSTGVYDAGKQAGYLTYEYWLKTSGTSATDFVASDRYMQAPDGRSVIDSVSEPSLLSQEYAAAMRGYFVPSVSGSYGFLAKAGTDGVAIYLSTDSDPRNKQLLVDKASTPMSTVLTAGQRYYFEFVHKVETGNQTASLLWLPPGATTYTVADISKFVPLNALGVSPQSPLPDPWQHGDIFVNRGWTAYSGLSSIDAGGSLEILAAGTGVNSHADGLHWVYQSLPDGGQVQARLLSCDYLSLWRSAGLMVRQSLNPGSPLAMFRTTSGTNIVFTCRLVQDGYAKDDTSVSYSGPVWMRLLRKGGSVYAYTSQNGVQWALFDQAELNLAGNAYVGLFATSGDEMQFCHAAFDNVAVSVDSKVMQSHTDSDGDGYSDYEEMQFLHSDPQVSDLNPPQMVDQSAGSSGTGEIGNWSTDGSAIYNVSVRGAVDYTLSAPKDGIYRLAIQGEPRVNTTTDTSWNVLVSVDGQYLETVQYELALGQSGMAYVYTPWLRAGSHTVRLYLDNVSIYRSFAFSSIELQAIDGVDANNNGIPDWMENRLAAQDAITSLTAQSRTSPFCLEGVAAYQQLAQLSVSGTAVQMLQGVGDGWYANVPLDANAPVTAQASFENGGKIDQKMITWVSTNVLNSGIPNNTLKIRKGDSLLLMACPSDLTSGSASITVTSGSQAVATLQTSGINAVPCQFAESGTYILSASYQEGSNPAVTGNLTVQVADASFAKPDPELTLGYSREWINPLLPSDTVVQSDPRMSVVELNPPADGGRDFQLQIDAAAQRIMLARLNDGTKDGPILDRAVITGIDVSSGAQTGIYTVQQYADGSRLVEMRIILSSIPDDLSVEIKIFVAGVTFEDGTLDKWLTKADFDAQGQLKIRFIMAPNSYTSVCHHLYIYQGGTLLETQTH